MTWVLTSNTDTSDWPSERFGAFRGSQEKAEEIAADLNEEESLEETDPVFSYKAVERDERYGRIEWSVAIHEPGSTTSEGRFLGYL